MTDVDCFHIPRIYELVDYKGLVIADGGSLEEIIHQYAVRERWDGPETEPDIHKIGRHTADGGYVYLSEAEVQAFTSELSKRVTFKQVVDEDIERFRYE